MRILQELANPEGAGGSPIEMRNGCSEVQRVQCSILPERKGGHSCIQYLAKELVKFKELPEYVSILETKIEDLENKIEKLRSS